jgi:hypothetical protein
MKFEVSYRTGTTHEVEVAGPTVSIGRDPECDIVLNEPKCSRRHAVVEEGPDGLQVRDSGSANGIFVNGRRVDQSPLKPGDTIRLGDVQLKVLAELGETVVMASEDIESLGPEAPTPNPEAVRLPPPPKAPPRPTPPRPEPPRTGPRRSGTPPPRAQVPTRTLPRPVRRGAPTLTVNVLAALWALSVPVSVGACVVAAIRLKAGLLGWVLASGAALVLAAAGAVMAFGLRSVVPWARHAQLGVAGVGLIVCPFTLASATVLFYLTRPEAKAAFEGAGDEGDSSSELTFALSLVGMLGLGVALTAAAVLLLGWR